MNFWLLMILAVGLSVDAFAVSVCKGLAMDKKTGIAHMVVVGAWFGGFQALMPLAGYFLGSFFLQFISSIDHWVAFGLLVFIGVNMIRESLSPDSCSADSASLSFKTMLIMALATSIDALAVGIALAMSGDTNIWAAVTVIGCTTFTLSAVGLKFGSVFGRKFGNNAGFAGGCILIIIGIKILLDHIL